MKAPFRNDLANISQTVICRWKTCADGMRIRVSGWKNGSKATVLIFQGRTEYSEKYGGVISHWISLGYDVVTLDWRGQGLSTRCGQHRNIGHVEKFSDYQLDIKAALDFITEHDFAKLEILLCHSMGGTIGLRALHNGLDVKKVIFSAPMWGIYLTPIEYISSKVVLFLTKLSKNNARIFPTTSYESYVRLSAFKDNILTNSQKQYTLYQEHLEACPDLRLGGPSIQWFQSAQAETKELCSLPPPSLPCLCLLGGSEKIVNSDIIKNMMKKWKNGILKIYPNAQHEILMEEEHITTLILKEIKQFLNN